MNFKQIKTYEDACTALNLDPKALPDFSMQSVEEQTASLAHEKLKIVARALNAGWKPNWNSSKETDRKWYPWFDMEVTEDNPTGFTLDGVGVYCTHTYVGSRLCYCSREVTQHAAKHFEELYKQYFIIA